MTSSPKWRDHVADDRLDLERQRAAVGVAQHEVAGALDDGRLEHPQRELGVALVAVEEVLGVEQHPQAVRRRGTRPSRPPWPRPRRASVCSASVDVVVPRLADDADRRRARLDQVAQRRVVVDLALRPPGRAEGHERRRVELQLGGAPAGRTRRPSGWRPASRPRCSATPRWSSCSAMRSLSSTVSDTPSTWLPSRSVVSKISTDSGSGRSDAQTCSTQSLYRSTWPRTASAVLLQRSPSSSGPGTGPARSSTELTGVTSAAVPHRKISSAM